MTGKAIAATTIMVIVLIMMPINSQPLLLVVAPVTGVLIYFVSLWLVRGLTRDDIAVAQSYITNQ